MLRKPVVREIRKSGTAGIITIPQDTEFKIGDNVLVEQPNEFTITITKIDVKRMGGLKMGVSNIGELEFPDISVKS